MPAPPVTSTLKVGDRVAIIAGFGEGEIGTVISAPKATDINEGLPGPAMWREFAKVAFTFTEAATPALAGRDGTIGKNVKELAAL